MNSRQIDCFLEVAKERSFSRASENLFLTQPVVSYQIGSLERELGFPLFLRDKHVVELTPSGEILFRELTNLKTSLSCAVHRARSLYKERCNSLNLGWVVGLDEKLLASVVRDCQEALPGIQVNLTSHRYATHITNLLNSEIDVVFNLLIDVQDIPGINYLPLFESTDYCYVNKANPLSSKNHLEISDLKDQVTVFPGDLDRVRNAEKVYLDVVKAYPEAKVICITDYYHNVMPLLMANTCVSMHPLPILDSEGRIVSIPLGHYDPIFVCIAWRADDVSTKTLTAIEIIKRLFSRTERTGK